MRPRKPPGGLRLLIGNAREIERQPERAARRLDVLPALEKAGMRPAAGVNARVFVTNQESGRREAIEILGLERCLRIRGGQARERISPGAAVERRPGLVQRVRASHLTIMSQGTGVIHLPEDNAVLAPRWQALQE